MKRIDMILASIVAIIFLQTLFFKFSGASESIFIFKTLGVEPWGRYFSGLVELVCAILLLKNKTRVWGFLFSFLTMSGAVLSHFFILGLEIQGDGGLLFAMAMGCLIFSLIGVVRQFKNLLPVFVVIFLPTLSWGGVTPNNESEFGIYGYDPVTYFEASGPKMGAKKFQFLHQGIKYLFTSENNLGLFKKSPEKYLPAYGGWCAYAMAEGEKVDIDPLRYKIINGKNYLFYNGLWGDTLKKWNQKEVELKTKADQYWKKLNDE